MRKQFPVLEVIGGVLGLGATTILMWQRFNPDYSTTLPRAFHSDQLAGNIIFTILLLVPFLTTIIAAFLLPKQSRWPMLLCSSVLSLFWLTSSKLTENFQHAPFPTPSGTLFPASFVLFLPATIVLIIAMYQSLRDGVIRSLPRRKAIILGTLSLSSACVLGVSFYVLFLNQGSELWSRMVYGGEWVRSPSVMYLPPPIGQGGQAINFGVVNPVMASISTGILSAGILLLVMLFRTSRRYAKSIP